MRCTRTPKAAAAVQSVSFPNPSSINHPLRTTPHLSRHLSQPQPLYSALATVSFDQSSYLLAGFGSWCGGTYHGRQIKMLHHVPQAVFWKKNLDHSFPVSAILGLSVLFLLTWQMFLLKPLLFSEAYQRSYKDYKS
eukprot:3843231-Rhodomonas_salina.2